MNFCTTPDAGQISRDEITMSEVKNTGLHLWNRHTEKQFSKFKVTVETFSKMRLKGENEQKKFKRTEKQCHGKLGITSGTLITYN